MRLRLGARIGLTLALNLALLGAVFGALLVQQNRKGLESMLLAPSVERVRGMAAELAETGSRFAAEVVLKRYAEAYGVDALLYEANGRRVAGEQVVMPEEVQREIRRPPGRADDVREGRTRGQAHPVFLVRDSERGRYWVGVHFPRQREDEDRTMRHVLVIGSSSLLWNRLFFDWPPWALGILAAVALSVLCWAPLVHSVLRSIGRMRVAAGQIAEGRFDVQIAGKGKDELGELAVSIEKMADRIARLVHGQRRFLADVAHELCAPLSRVQLSVGILEDRAGSEEQEYVKALERDVRHMSNLVSDLLSFSKGAARKVEPRWLALPALLEDVATSECGGKAKVQVHVNSSLRVFADEEYLRRAVANLIRNAVTYAGEAGPIDVIGERMEAGVRIRVEDEGPGLEEEELEAVFEPFYRPDRSRDRATGGAGLGLAIVKGCMEAIGGSVRCRNKSPKGLQVDLEVPDVAAERLRKEVTGQ